MQDRPAPTPPLPPHLAEAEKLEICSLVSAGLPLPSRYKERLFPSLPADAGVCARDADAGMPMDTAHCAKSAATEPGAEFSLCEYFPKDGAADRIDPFQDGEWRKLLIHGDNRDVLQAVVDGALSEAVARAGGIKLIYADPPFAVGSDFMIGLAVGGGISPEGAPSAGKKNAATAKKTAHEARRKAGESLSAIAFTDSWGEGPDSFAAMLFERIKLMHAALAEDGSIYLHCDRRAAPLARLFMDHVFGPERMLGEIIWHYTGGGRARRYFSRKHDVILHYAKSARWTFNLDAVRVPYKESSGYARSGIVSAAGKRYAPHPQGTPVDDVWSIPIVNPMGHERLAYPTQKPEALLDRIIKASSNPGDLVADFFCGSGTTLAVAERLGRKWLGADKGVFSIHETRKRLLSLEASPFAILQCAGQHSPCPGKENATVAEPGGLSPDNSLSNGSVILEGREIRLPAPVIKARAVPAAGGFFIELNEFRFPGNANASELHALAASWHDLIDYWSVDCNSVSGAFQSRWQSFRTRRDRGIALQSPVFPLPEKGMVPFRAAILVVDIFSRAHMPELDTTALFPFTSHADGD